MRAGPVRAAVLAAAAVTALAACGSRSLEGERVGVDEDEGLFGGCVAFVGCGAGLCGGGAGLFVVLPRISNVTEVEGLPSGEGVHFGEQRGEWFASARGEAVRGQSLYLPDFGVEFITDDDCAELTVESADSVELLVQQLNGWPVHASSRVE